MIHNLKKSTIEQNSPASGAPINDLIEARRERDEWLNEWIQDELRKRYGL